ncbi:MAG: Hdr-like menaquinol oxidoreductase cytochrome c subunit [Gammaproteobacteria bacterium]|nr:Hdr-like menaquinol oxidoreductase cytochrome c subunit [Gammaproteobacteria bacterium]
MRAAVAWVGMIAVWCTATAARAEVPAPSFPAAEGTECVEPTDVMRREHMRFLLHQRDLTVHRGIRTPQHSLVECLECHTAKDDQGRFMPVDAPGQFCQSCHAYSGVKMDCFECHASKPRATPRAADGVSSGNPVRLQAATRR